jgi:hypothetical protein
MPQKTLAPEEKDRQQEDRAEQEYDHDVHRRSTFAENYPFPLPGKKEKVQ